MGRPARESNHDLAERIQRACVSSDRSLSDLARRIGVSPSTLTRACKDQRFSRELQSKLTGPLNTVHSASINDDKSLQETLQLLDSLQKMLPVLHRRLVAALDLQTRVGHTAE